MIIVGALLMMVILGPVLEKGNVMMETSNTSGEHDRPQSVTFWVTLVRGILAFALGLALIVQPDKTRPMLVNFMGMFWLASGIMSVRWGLAGRRARKKSLVAGVVGVLTGLIVITRKLMFGLLDEVLVLYLLGGVILLTGLLHIVGGFRTGEEATRQRSWASLLLGLFEIVLGGLLLISPLEYGPAVYWAATIWALLGGFLLTGDALRLRAQAHRDGEHKEVR